MYVTSTCVHNMHGAGGWTAARMMDRLSESWCPSQMDSVSTVSCLALTFELNPTF